MSTSTLNRRSGEFRCSVCGVEISRMAARMDHTCRGWKCRQQYHAQLQLRIRQSRVRESVRLQEFQAKLSQYREQHALEEGIDEAESFVPICVPGIVRLVIPVNEERKLQLRENLKRLIEDALELDTCQSEHRSIDRDATNSCEMSLPVLTGQACGICGGYCCTDGGDHGHLTADVMRTYIDANPAVEPEDLIDKYLSYVGSKTYEDSCIFHGAGGCTLPRSMRSDVCNTHQCNGLKDMSEGVQQGQTRFFVAVSHDEQISRHCFLSDDPKRC